MGKGCLDEPFANSQESPAQGELALAHVRSGSLNPRCGVRSGMSAPPLKERTCSASASMSAKCRVDITRVWESGIGWDVPPAWNQSPGKARSRKRRRHRKPRRRHAVPCDSHGRVNWKQERLLPGATQCDTVLATHSNRGGRRRQQQRAVNQRRRRRTRTTSSIAVTSMPSGGSGSRSIPTSPTRSISWPSPSTKK